MKRVFTLFLLLFAYCGLYAQKPSAKKYSTRAYSSQKAKEVNFNGQWKGGFDENVNGFSLDISGIAYVLELTTEGSSVSGYSYTYFTEGNKRYYTICRLTGTLDRETNDIVVTEIERTKFNTPPDFQNCFQTHRLHYVKDSADMEILRGTWVPAPNQGRGCGSGTTELTRRVVNRIPLGIKPPVKTTASKAPLKKPEIKKALAEAPKKPIQAAPKKPAYAIAKTEQPKPGIEKKQTLISDSPISETPITQPEIKNSTTLTPKFPKYENRRKEVVKTITIEQPTFRLDFYDNGEIDGDSITVFYNGKIVLSHQMLSDKPISLTLALDKNVKENVVTMYADNLGTIPPNTALMIVTDGNKRYEVRMESDYGKSGTVIFRQQ